MIDEITAIEFIALKLLFMFDARFIYFATSF